MSGECQEVKWRVRQSVVSLDGDHAACIISHAARWADTQTRRLIEGGGGANSSGISLTIIVCQRPNFQPEGFCLLVSDCALIAAVQLMTEEAEPKNFHSRVCLCVCVCEI